MATAPKPHNATPQKLQLKPPQIPRMPFGSPMGEEILSPTSDPSHTPPQVQKEAQIPMHGSRMKRKSIMERRLSTPKTRNNEQNFGGSDSPSKAKWPGLNVITDFSRVVDAVTNTLKPQAHVQRPIHKYERGDTGRLQELEQTEDPQNDHGQRQSPRIQHQRSGKSLKGSGSKSRLDDLKRTSTKSSNLSPSDRAVVIGLSVSPDEAGQQSAGHDREHSLGSDAQVHQRRHSLTPSIAPSIIVTPAKEVAPWSLGNKGQGSPPNRRPISSVYSQMPGPGDKKAKMTKVPPVPPLPLRPGVNPNVTNERNPSRDRYTSNCTIFDEEPSPDAAADSRPGSRDSQLHILAKSTSADTLTPKRYSQGWWNIIKSPFFPKSPMSLKFHTTPQEGDAPPLPAPIKSSPPRHSHKAELVEDSPGHDQKSHIAESAHTSWTDSSVDVEGERGRLSFGEPITIVKDLKEEPHHQHKTESYSVPMTFEGLGAASEYYEACLYDMHSSTPYFECQNHRCWPSTLGIGGYIPRGLDGPEAPPVTRGMALEDANSGEPGKAEKGMKEESKIPSLQVPTNRFSASFREAIESKTKTKARPESKATVIEDVDATPDVQEAKAAPVMRAPEPIVAVNPPPRKESLSQEPSSIHESPYFNKPAPTPKALPTPPPRLPEKDATPERQRDPGRETPSKHFISGIPTNPRHKYEEPFSPAPPTPQAQRQTPQGGIVMTEVPKSHSSRETSPSRGLATTHITNHYYTSHRRRDSHPTTTGDLWPPMRPQRPPREDEPFNDQWVLNEKAGPPPSQTRKNKIMALIDGWLLRKHAQKLARSPDEQGRHKKKKKRLLIIIAVALILLIILIVVLAMTLTHRGDRTPVESQWLNITGYPPVPTGFSTVAQPEAAHEESGCVQPTTMWSCALPKEEQQNIQPNAPTQPNFRIEIKFQNGTNATTGNSSKLGTRSSAAFNPVSARSLIRTKLLQIRDNLNNALYSPSPSPPDQEDQSFLGETTDKVEAPFDGEYTPFHMTFHPATALPSRLLKRDDSDSDSSDTSNSTDQFPNITSSIPAPSKNPDGTASPASLYPYPASQPLRLFDRGRPTEHYGFYTYFDRSIFLNSTAPLESSSITGNNEPTDPSDANGGSEQRSASVRCTWAQTRFLVQIWTNKGNPAPLLQGNSTSPTSSASDEREEKAKDSTSSANNFTRPGSFPYPISITLDRHGGDVAKKMIYCYGLDNNAKPISDAKKLQLEDREFGGKLENPALGPWKDVKVSTKEGGPGGIDGGTGGCGCRWQNWK